MRKARDFPFEKKRARICALDNCGRFKNQTYVEAAFHYCELHLRPKSHLNDALNL